MTEEEEVILEGVREYCEEMHVSIVKVDDPSSPGFGRLAIKARNEAGFNHTLVDLEDLLDWFVRFKKPEVKESEWMRKLREQTHWYT